MTERLQKIIAAAGLASRREAEKWIADGRVAVNGRKAVLGDVASAQDVVTVDGRKVDIAERKFYILLNKPVGYVTTLHDPQGRPIVTDLVKAVRARLFPVGRLDLNTEGLLLLTNDGDFAHHLAHPRHAVEKTYLVRVRGLLGESAKQRLVQGVSLDDGLTAPARVEKIRSTGNHTWFELTIHEGRNRQVRRMCEAVGLPVSRLKRIRVASLDVGDLPVGKYRFLSPGEVARLKRL